MRGRMGRPGLVGMAARTAVVAGTATAVSGAVHNKQAAAAQAQAAPAPQAAAPALAPAAGEDDVVSQLTQLASMKATGVLSDAEFEAAKAKVLAG